MKTKIFSLFLALIASVGTIFASDIQVDGIWYDFDSENLTASVTYQGDSYYAVDGEYTGYVVIPDTVSYNDKKYAVKSIGLSAFSYCRNLKSVTIPSSVTSIERYAFEYCEGMTSITIPNSVTKIGTHAFFECYKANITIPNSVVEIGEGAFYNCVRITSVIIGNTVTSIERYAFFGCTGMKSVTIGNSVTKIGEYAFSNCTGLTSITIPNSVTEIGKSAFRNCDYLTSVIISNSVTSIEESAFESCFLLKSITCEAVTPPTLGDGVFYGVKKAIPLYVPAGSVQKYKDADQWKDFGDNIKPIQQASESAVADLQAEPTVNSVTIEWPTVSEATIYTIEIKKNGELICTLSFNEQGQLLNISFAAPSRHGNNQAPQALQTAAGWQYTISGLDSNTDYTYTVIAKKNESDTTPLFSKTIPFKTIDAATALENVQSENAPSTKVLKEGFLYIQNNSILYTPSGQQVK